MPDMMEISSPTSPIATGSSSPQQQQVPASSSSSPSPPPPPPSSLSSGTSPDIPPSPLSPIPQHRATLCALCPGTSTPRPTKYTCPGCQTKTCSLACSRAHKQQTGCSGERNRAAYVPMKQYGWGAMMSDYTFLEDVGRKVKDAGREIVQGGYMHHTHQDQGLLASRGGRGRGSRGAIGGGRGGGGGGRNGRAPLGRTKRDIFKQQMELRDVDVDLLPLGMKRRSANQSGWDFKTQTASLTIEFRIHRPRDPLAPATVAGPPEPLVLLVHRIKSSQSLLEALRQVVSDRQKKENLKGRPNAPTTTSTSISSVSESGSTDWLRSLVFPSDEDPEGFTAPKFTMRAPPDPILILQWLKQEQQTTDGDGGFTTGKEYASELGRTLQQKLHMYGRPSAAATPAPSASTSTSGSKRKSQNSTFRNLPKVYYALSSTNTLLSALKYTSFVEFPTIEVFEDGDPQWDGVAFVAPEALAESAPGSSAKPSTNGSSSSTQNRSAAVVVQEPAAKRRKLDPKAGKAKIQGLLGGYGTESESDSAHDHEAGPGSSSPDRPKGVAALVGDYAGAGSDEEETMQVDDEDDDGGEGEGEELDPAALLELVRQVKGDQWVKSQELGANADDDVLDWEGSDADAEGEDDDGEYV